MGDSDNITGPDVACPQPCVGCSGQECLDALTYRQPGTLSILILDCVYSYLVAAVEDMNQQRRVVAVVADLMFGSRIRGTAQQVGTAVNFVRDAAALQEQAAGADLVLLDLETRWLDAATVIGQLKQTQATATVPVVAFVSHVNAEAIAGARAAGADRVMARSAFVRELPMLLQGGLQ
jgi:CheY-like chemotaxis protein